MKSILPLDKVEAMAIADSKTSRLLWFILVVGLALRLLHAVDQPTLILFRHGGGGDSGWYLANGAGFFSGQEHGYTRGISYYISALPTPPFYIIFSGIFQTVLTKHESVVAIRIAQSLISIGTAFLAFQIARYIARNDGAGLIAAALIALHPTFVAESSIVATETFYVFFLAIGIWLYLGYVAGDGSAPSHAGIPVALALCLTALALGMATLTRAVSVLFPLIIVAHLLLISRRRGSRLPVSQCVFFVAVYLAMLSTWTIYNLAMWNRFVIVSDQLMPAMWRATVTDDGSPQQNDAILLQDAATVAPDDCVIDCKFQHATETYVKQIVARVSQEPTGYVAQRLGELAYSIFQPHGTTAFGSVSIKDAASAWWQGDRSLEGLLQIARIEGFAAKSAIWFLHVFAIVFGLAGMWLYRRSWGRTLPLIGFATYTILVHLVLHAVPRYLFPIEFIWLIFAAVALNAPLQRRGLSTLPAST